MMLITITPEHSTRISDFFFKVIRGKGGTISLSLQAGQRSLESLIPEENTRLECTIEF